MIWLLLILTIIIVGTVLLLRSTKADVNHDNVVDSKDVIQAAKNVANKVTKMVDLTDDGKITLDDVKKASKAVKKEAIKVKRKYNKKK